jgi:phospholipid/cholesterol/gamma-HCH transport system substrate-binding protein
MKRRDFATGLFLLAAGGLLLAAYLYSSLTHYARKASTYYADGPDIGGLEEGSEIEMGGYRMGAVRNVKVMFDPDLHFELELSLKKDIPIPKGTIAVSANHSLSGGRFLDLRPPAGGGAHLPPGSHLPIQSEPGLQAVLTRADHAFEYLAQVAAEANKVFAAEPGNPGIKDAIARLSRAVADADAAANAAGRLIGRLDHTTEQLAPSLQTSAEALAGTMQNAKSAAGRLEQLLEKEAPAIDEVLTQAAARMTELKSLLSGYDAEKNPSIKATLEHLDAATKSLQDLTADVKAHPWKLLRKGS